MEALLKDVNSCKYFNLKKKSENSNIVYLINVDIPRYGFGEKLCFKSINNFTTLTACWEFRKITKSSLIPCKFRGITASVAEGVGMS